MKYRTTPYILEKDGVYYSFPSEKAALRTKGWRMSNCGVDMRGEQDDSV